MTTESAHPTLGAAQGVVTLETLRVKRSAAAKLWLMARRKPLGAVSALLLAVIVLTAIFADLIAPFDPTATHPRDKLQGPSATYWLGTDDLGRDMFSRIVLGAR